MLLRPLELELDGEARGGGEKSRRRRNGNKVSKRERGRRKWGRSSPSSRPPPPPVSLFRILKEERGRDFGGVRGPGSEREKRSVLKGREGGRGKNFRRTLLLRLLFTWRKRTGMGDGTFDVDFPSSFFFPWRSCKCTSSSSSKSFPCPPPHQITGCLQGEQGLLLPLSLLSARPQQGPTLGSLRQVVVWRLAY